MKKIIPRKMIRQSLFSAMLVSVLTLAVFAFIAGSTIAGTSQQKFKLPDGRWELARNLSGGKTEVIRGNVDSRGRFEGPAEIIYERDFERTSTEQVEMKAGKRHGTSKVTFTSGRVEYWCYEHGEVVKKGKCDEKSYASPANDNSAFQVFSYKFPWFAFKLDAFGFDSSYVKAYLDTLELLIYSKGSVVDDFEDYYDEAISDLNETPYDSIIQLNALASIHHGFDMILNNEFRLATLDSYMDADSNTYNLVKTIYPNYLLNLNSAGVTNDDFEGFCIEFDAIMSGYDPIAPDDPYLMDSLDQRMYRAIDSIYSSGEASAKEWKSLKNTYLIKTIGSIQNFEQGRKIKLLSQPLALTPSEVAEIVTYSIIGSFLNGDLIRDAVREAYSIQHEIATLPTVVTDLLAETSSTSVSLEGNVLRDGGGEVTDRGIAWGTVYNPTLDNQVISAGTGTGDFLANLTGLTEGVTYYARAFATNSAGTSYGNCISFVAGSAVGTNEGNIYTLDFQVFPNPASNNITLSFRADGSEKRVFTMVDLSGKVVLRNELTGIIIGENSILLNISEVHNGFYNCRIEGGKNVYTTKKIIVNR